jgi:hypothetical protein
MAYRLSGPLHPLDDGLGQLDRPEGHSREQAEVIQINRRMRHGARRLRDLKAEYGDQLPPMPWRAVKALQEPPPDEAA